MTDQNASEGPISAALAIGHSVWLQHIGRALAPDELARAAHDEQWLGTSADQHDLTSALINSPTLEQDIAELVSESRQISSREIYRRLMIREVQDAADALHPLYSDSEGQEGLVNLPMMPTLAEDAAAMVALAVDLHKHVDRSNVLFEVPATQEGLKAFEAMLSLGMNVNVTRVYGVSRYRQVAHAYIRGLERRLAEDMPIDYLCSTVSFGIAAVDRQVIAQQAQLPGDGAVNGHIGTANAQVAYGHFVNLFGSDAFARLRQAGAHPQRLMWTELQLDTFDDPADAVQRWLSLVGPDTISSIPPSLLQRLPAEPLSGTGLTRQLAAAHATITSLSDRGISLGETADTLTREAIEADQRALQGALDRISEKTRQGLN